MAAAVTYVRWSAEDLPDGLTINEETGVISGTPNVPIGTYTAYITVETNYGFDGKYITIVVGAPKGWEPVITPDQTIEISVDEVMHDYEVQGNNVKKTV